jgi:hypothetical protein
MSDPQTDQPRCVLGRARAVVAGCDLPVTQVLPNRAVRSDVLSLAWAGIAILSEEGFGRLLRHPEPEASISPATAGRDTKLPRAEALDFDTWPARVHSHMAATAGGA